MKTLHGIALTVLCGFLGVSSSRAQTDAAPKTVQEAPAKVLAKTTVGMRIRIDEIPLPGSKLRVRPVADAQKADVILRILNVFPHGSSWRYNL